MILSLISCVMLYGYGMFVVSAERRIWDKFGYKVGEDSFIDDLEIKQMVEEIKREKEISEFRSSRITNPSLRSDFSNLANKRLSENFMASSIEQDDQIVV